MFEHPLSGMFKRLLNVLGRLNIDTFLRFLSLFSLFLLGLFDNFNFKEPTWNIYLGF